MRNPIGIRAVTLFLLAGTVGATHAHVQDWTEQNKGKAKPAGRFGHAMAYDSARQRVVLFGGWDNQLSRRWDTWEWDGNTWTEKTPALSPRARFGHAMAYDSSRQRVVVFGGNAHVGTLGDTWEWDGKNWIQRTPAVSPAAREWHAMVYDSARQRTVLFGGLGLGGSRNDTWEWDGANWRQCLPVSSPPPRQEHALAYDASRKRVLLFGGFLNITTLWVYSDTWEWDGNNWTRRMAGTNPSARYRHAMVYDAVNRCTVLFGSGPPLLNETWEWDGSTWTRRVPTRSPSHRDCTALAYDSSRHRVVLFGGSDPQVPPLADTWEYGFPGTVVASGTARPGATVSLLLTAPNDATLFYQAGSSLGTGPIMVDIRQIGLSPDALLAISVGEGWPAVFIGYRGVIDRQGHAQAAIHIPNILALIGTHLHTAFVTMDPQAPSGIRSISKTESFAITK